MNLSCKEPALFLYTKISCIANDKNIFCDLARYFSQVYKIKLPKNLVFLFFPSIFGPFHSGTGKPDRRRENYRKKRDL